MPDGTRFAEAATSGELSPPMANKSGRIIEPFRRLSIADIKIAAAKALRRSNVDDSEFGCGDHKMRATGKS
jgi:hypothetical protein